MTEERDSVVVDGVQLRAADREGRSWTYVPARPGLERDATGRPMLSIVEAGPVAFLQVTARVALSEQERARLLEGLRALRPAATSLEVAPIQVSRVALEVKEGDRWVAVAESGSSQMVPWTAALAATLEPSARAALRDAASGERGRARLRASIALPAAPQTIGYAEASGSVRAESPFVVAAASYTTSIGESSPAGPASSLELSADLSGELVPEERHQG
jgi:hypothetical protein